METAEQLFCGACGDPVPSVDGEGRGPCCAALPNPWHLGENGLYNQTSHSNDPVGEDYHEEHDDDEPEDFRPRCEHCGSMEWNATASQRIDTTENEYHDESIRYDWDHFDIQVSCAACGREARHSVESS